MSQIPPLHQKLLKFVTDHGQDVDSIAQILEALDAHSDLIDFPRVLRGLTRVLDAMQQPAVLGQANWDLERWRDVSDWIISLRNDENLLITFGAKFYLGDERKNKNPIIGAGVKRYGFPYAVLWHEPYDKENEAEFYRLIAQFMLAFQLLPESHALEDQLYAANRELRLISGLDVIMTPTELNVWCSSADFLRRCQNYDVAESASEYAELFAPIVRAVRYCNGDTPPARSGGGSGTRTRKRNKAGLGVQMSQGEDSFYLDDPDDPNLLPGKYSILVSPTDLPEDIEGDQLAPDELTEPFDICLLEEGDSERAYAADLLKAQSVQNHIIRARQYLPFSYSQFTLTEISNLLSGCTEEFLECLSLLALHPGRQKSLRARMEAIAGLHLMLWLGQPLLRVRQLRVVEMGDVRRSTLEMVRGVDGCVSEFRFVPHMPSYLSEENLEEGATRKRASCVSLPDLAESAYFIEALQHHFPDKEDTSFIFNQKPKALEKNIRKLLKKIGLGDSRYTIEKSRTFLHRRIISETHDVVSASFLSGYPSLSANTPAYYSQLNVARLRRIYINSSILLLKHIYACGGVVYEEPMISEYEESGGIGARNCLTTETVIKNINAMLAVLRSKPTGELSNLVAWHNCMTLWTTQLFMMVTGCRAIRNPLMSVQQFDPRLRVGALGDKDADDRHMSRLVCLYKIVRNQLEAYQKHCKEISRQLSGYLSNDMELSESYFLEINSKGIRKLEVRPNTIRGVMGSINGYTSHPVNSFRKFIRTELIERNCSPEVVNAYMGHWLLGEEPQNSLSSFCPNDYVATLDKNLQALMSELPWVVIHSRWVDKRPAK
ncbi:hypothetical protein SAMN05216296_0035 [Pseudomonas pohangensis]|uniref:Uncharacterized protein n=1 Tax=Pseudomonas pohangensis TaxID=364197 RepID=A0A1H2DV01_9PSED|nr:hypothetical protein [Pseudomonas pohangensis]SDT86695.1 hypothetical protein SAMN05216296_0035 [Pseudomonas pohangensis]